MKQCILTDSEKQRHEHDVFQQQMFWATKRLSALNEITLYAPSYSIRYKKFRNSVFNALRTMH